MAVWFFDGQMNIRKAIISGRGQFLISVATYLCNKSRPSNICTCHRRTTYSFTLDHHNCVGFKLTAQMIMTSSAAVITTCSVSLNQYALLQSRFTIENCTIDPQISELEVRNVIAEIRLALRRDWNDTITEKTLIISVHSSHHYRTRADVLSYVSIDPKNAFHLIICVTNHLCFSPCRSFISATKKEADSSVANERTETNVLTV